MPQFVQLDRSKPLVDAAFGVASGALSPKDGLLVLRAAELRHGVSVWPEPEVSCLWAGSFRPLGAPPTDVERAAALANPERLQALYSEGDEDVPGLHGFLTETEFVMEGMQFTNDFYVLTQAGVIHAWTHRAWGAELANWANATQWRGVGSSWRYMDFYCAAAARIADYTTWSRGMEAILRSRNPTG